MVRSAFVLAVAMVFPVEATAATIGPIEPLTSPAPAGAGEPRLTVGPGRALAMSWLEPRPSGGHRLRWALRKREWSRPVTIAEGDSFFVNWADFPSVRWLGGNRWAAHWLWRIGDDTYAYQVRISFSEDGGRTWQKPIVPHRDGTATEHGFVTLVPEQGGVRAFWLDGRNFVGHREDENPGPEMTLRTARVTPDGAMRDESELDGRACDCCPTAAAATSDGVLVAYRDRSSHEIRDIALVRHERDGWSSPVPLHADAWTIAGCPVNGPALDSDRDRVAIAWFTAAADTPRVLAAWSSDGGRRFSAPIRVDDGNPLGRSGITLLPDGGALVTWLESGKDQARILGRLLGAGGDRSASFTIARTSTARASGFPQIIRVGNRVFFAWTEAGAPSQVRLAQARLGQSRELRAAPDVE